MSEVQKQDVEFALVQLTSHAQSTNGVKVVVTEPDGTERTSIVLGPAQSIVGTIGAGVRATLSTVPLSEVTQPTDPEGPQLTDASGQDLKAPPKLVVV